MNKTIPFILTAMILGGVIFGEPAAAGDTTVEKAVFYVQ